MSMSALPIPTPHSPTGTTISIRPLTVIIITGNIIRIVIISVGLAHLGDGTVIKYLAAVVSSPGVEVSLHSP